MKKKLFFGLLIVVLVALPFATACDTTPTDVTLTIGVGGEGLTNIDPTTLWGANVQPCNLNVFEFLVGFDEDDQVVPWLAESWEWSDSYTTLTMQLRDDAYFSDGTQMTSADVIFSMNREATTNMAVMDQLTQGYKSIEADGDFAVVFKFEHPTAQFIGQTLGMGLMVISEAQYTPYGNDAYPDIPIGTGAYQISAWQEGQYVDLVPNEYYWGDEAKFSSVHCIMAPDESNRIAMLQAGEVDMITQVSGANVPTLETAGYNRWDVPQAHDIVLIFDLQNENHPWYDVKVRQAINYVIDQDALITTVFNGVPQSSVWLMDWELGYQEEFSEAAYPYDLAEAQALMTSAGYADGFEMPLTYAAFMEWGVTITDYLTSQLELINITVVPTGISDFMEFMSAQKEWHAPHTSGGCVFLFDVGWPGNPDPTINLTNGFYSGKDNTMYYRDDLDDIISEAIQTVDNDARAILIAEAYEIVMADLPVIPLMLEVATSISVDGVTYEKSYGGMGGGPMKLCDLSVD